MSSSAMEINSTNWQDYLFERLELDFDNIKIHLNDESDRNIKMVAEGYIGISYVGHWDESVVQSIKVEKGTILTEKALTIIKNNYGDMVAGGGYRKLEDEWNELVIEFIDNIQLSIVCRDVTVCAE